jgi:DNA invertase Pin-like site-specific DNA recombinase
VATIGYARVSTADQELEVQMEQLRSIPCEKIFQEKISGASVERPQLTSLLEYVREGDILVVCKLDRIARSTKNLLDIVELLEKKKVAFKVLNINLDTTTATGKLMLSMLAAIGQFEREMMLERQAEGIRIAKTKGIYTGRKPTARLKSTRALELLALGRTKQSVSDELGISLSSIYRISATQRKNQVEEP